MPTHQEQVLQFDDTQSLIHQYHPLLSQTLQHFPAFNPPPLFVGNELIPMQLPAIHQNRNADLDEFYDVNNFQKQIPQNIDGRFHFAEESESLVQRTGPDGRIYYEKQFENNNILRGEDKRTILERQQGYTSNETGQDRYAYEKQLDNQGLKYISERNQFRPQETPQINYKYLNMNKEDEPQFNNQYTIYGQQVGFQPLPNYQTPRLQYSPSFTPSLGYQQTYSQPIPSYPEIKYHQPFSNSPYRTDQPLSYAQSIYRPIYDNNRQFTYPQSTYQPIHDNQSSYRIDQSTRRPLRY